MYQYLRHRLVHARWRVLVGPVLHVSLFEGEAAYVDPGNFATNFAGGAEHG
jgi:Mn2+/Fe2+ NRAMP family transporter